MAVSVRCNSLSSCRACAASSNTAVPRRTAAVPGPAAAAEDGTGGTGEGVGEGTAVAAADATPGVTNGAARGGGKAAAVCANLASFAHASL